MPIDEDEPLKNPLFTLWARAMAEDARGEVEVYGSLSIFRAREKACKEYAWAVPNVRCLTAVLGLDEKVLEVGAGRGYWAWCMTQLGGDVMAIDDGSWKYPSFEDFPVEHLDPTAVDQRVMAEWQRTLFICWPHFDDGAWDGRVLRLYRLCGGQRFVYVGEDNGGCTGSPLFWLELDKNWECVERIPVPSWPGIHDELSVWKPK